MSHNIQEQCLTISMVKVHELMTIIETNIRLLSENEDALRALRLIQRKAEAFLQPSEDYTETESEPVQGDQLQLTTEREGSASFETADEDIRGNEVHRRTVKRRRKRVHAKISQVSVYIYFR